MLCIYVYVSSGHMCSGNGSNLIGHIHRVDIDIDRVRVEVEVSQYEFYCSAKREKFI